jgi:hypothetical protein
VLGQQVLMGRMNIPAPLVLQQISFTNYSAILFKAATAPATAEIIVTAWVAVSVAAITPAGLDSGLKS